MNEHAKNGSVTITEDRVEVRGFEDDGTCRQTAILACIWAMRQLATELDKLMNWQESVISVD